MQFEGKQLSKEVGDAEPKRKSAKTFLKAMPLRDLSMLETVKNEVRSGNILILKVTPLMDKSIDDVKKAIDELCHFTESTGGDIARLGEERIVICPPHVKIWREKPAKTPVQPT
jgi:SepF-like predicted cell division protein (DUF552 family)